MATVNKDFIVKNGLQANDSISVGNETTNTFINSTSITVLSIQANGTIGSNGQVLSSNGSTIYWATPEAGLSVAGANMQIQFNDSGVLGAVANLAYNKTTNQLTIGNTSVNTQINSTSLVVNGAITGSPNVTANIVTAVSANISGSITGSPNVTSNNISTESLSTINGNITVANGQIIEKSVSLGTSFTVNLNLGTYFIKTIINANTFVIANAASSGQVSSFVLELTNGGSNTITWPGSIKWAGGVAPTLTASGVDIITFFTRDAGTTWRATPSLNYA